MTGPQRSYDADGITVHWDSTRCIHTARCLRALPEVFDVRRRPWIDVTAASADAIAEAVEACPTGALRYDRTDGTPGETPVRPAVAVPIADGPLLLMGDLRVETPDGEEIAREYRLTLCRCGRSRNQPFCDNSHVDAGFESTDCARRALAPLDDAARGDVTTVITSTDGPLLTRGALVVMDAESEPLASGERFALCRCGNSASKPFCDGSHKGRFESKAPEERAERRRAATPEAFEPNPHVKPPPAVDDHPA